MPILGEAVALVMGDTRIWSAGIYWDQNKFPNKTYFAPYAYKEELNTRKFKVGCKDFKESCMPHCLNTNSKN